MNYICDPTVVQTEELCMEAIEQSAYALKYVKDQTEKMCICAVSQDGCALQYVTNQTEAICMRAVKENGLALRYVHRQTDSIYMEAFRQIPFASQSTAFKVIFVNIYKIILYPSPQLISWLLKLYPSETNTINRRENVCRLMQYYKRCCGKISHIVQHTADILYRPNNVNTLVSYAKWHTTITNTKSLFLTM